jgi:hypothetical protein
MLPQMRLLNPIALNAFVMYRLGPLEVWGTFDSANGPGQIEASHTVPGT